MRGVERSRDRAWSHAERIGHLGIGEIGVVAEEHHEPLPLGQTKDGPSHVVLTLRGGQGALVGEWLLGPVSRPRSVSGDVEDDSPKPRFEVALPTETCATTKRPRERILNHVKRLVAVPEQRRHGEHKGTKAFPIERLDF